MPQRNDPFAHIFPDPEVPEEPLEAVPAVLQRRPSQAKRNRDWETQNKVMGYRGIPPTVDAAMQRIAQQLHVNKGEIARAFLEYALAAYQDGNLPLTPGFGKGKLTLFPGDR